MASQSTPPPPPFKTTKERAITEIALQLLHEEDLAWLGARLVALPETAIREEVLVGLVVQFKGLESQSAYAWLVDNRALHPVVAVALAAKGRAGYAELAFDPTLASGDGWQFLPGWVASRARRIEALEDASVAATAVRAMLSEVSHIMDELERRTLLASASEKLALLRVRMALGPVPDGEAALRTALHDTLFAGQQETQIQERLTNEVEKVLRLVEQDRVDQTIERVRLLADNVR